jgi:hypothetical protein
LKPAERKEILKWLKKLKFPDRYAANIKRAVNVGTGKLNGLKSHDYHIIMERLLLDRSTEEMRKTHGPDTDPRSVPFDVDAAYHAGGDLPHGRYVESH